MLKKILKVSQKLKKYLNNTKDIYKYTFIFLNKLMKALKNNKMYKHYTL